MAYKDLRAFLQRLEEKGQLLHVTQEVKLESDLGACGRAVTSVGEHPPALYFDTVTTEIPFVMCTVRWYCDTTTYHYIKHKERQT
jgi:UbiD family decarboxylase